MKKSFACLVLYAGAIFLPASAQAKLTPVQDLDRKYKYYHATYTAKPDYTYEEQHEWAVEVLDKRALDDLKRVRLSHSTSVETIEILEAYNLKSGGKRIDVPKDNYQVNTNKGRDKDAPVFSDRSSITAVFPEVEVGDTLVFSYVRRVNEPMFPGYFTADNTFSLATYYGDVRIEIVVPSGFSGLHRAREMKEKITRNKDAVHYVFTWKNTRPMKDDRQDYSVWNMEDRPGFAYSTFNSYEAIARAYGVRALPKAQVTERVKKLADEIVGGTKDKKEQARLLYEWVATRISYAGNCVGVGAVVPHDIDFILDNHMGDCKDHATLLEALLTYKGIASDQALINSGNIFELPSIPAVNSVNHVINYLPEFDLFVDSTSPDTPFGMIPNSIQGKPVLMVRNFVEGLKTPVHRTGSNKQVMRAKMKILEDGSMEGKVRVELYGDPAVDARSGWRKVSRDQEDEWLKNIFSHNGNIGHASLERDDPHPLLDTYEYGIEFQTKEFLMADSAGAFYVDPPLPTSYAVSDLVGVSDLPLDHPVACGSVTSIEEYEYTFPEKFTILDYPKSKQIEGADLFYRVTYALEGQKLTVSRELRDSTRGPICSADLMNEQREVLKKINRSLRSQIIYKPLVEEE